MGKREKILILLSLVFSVAAFFIVTSLAAKRDALFAVKVRTEQDLADMTKVKDKAESDLRDMTGQRDDLQQKLNEATSLVNDLDNKLRLKTAEAEDLADKLAQQQQETAKFKEELNQKEQEVSRLSSDNDKLRAAQDELALDLDSVRQELETAKLAGESAIQLGAVSAKTTIEGAVLAKRADYQFVVVDLGGKDGIQPEMVFAVSRSGKLVGRIAIGTVIKENMAEAKILMQVDGEQIQIGDRVSLSKTQS